MKERQNNIIVSIISSFPSCSDKWVIGILIIFLSSTIHTQKVSNLEYFWNTDPGIGQATQIPITSDSIIDISFSPSLAALQQGINTLFVRAQNDSMRWGFAQRSVIYVYPNASTANASTLEYFIDTDPGLGFGTQVPIPNSDSVDINFNIDVQNLTDGLHTLYVRARNSVGDWSFVQRHTFMKLGDLSSDITQLEYFIDVDPGLGNGTQVPVIPGQDVDVTFNVHLAGISQGLHTLYVRSRKANGLWSFAQNKPFLVLSNTTMPKITALEYYYDIDPGYGNARQVNITPADSVISTATFSLSGLTVGAHKLYIRAKDENNTWSHIFRSDVNVTATDNLYPAIAVTPALKTLNAVNCLASALDSFIVTNTGSNMLQVNISESASWMSISPAAMGIPAGESRTLYITATPSSTLPAQSSANITFTTNDPVNPTVTRPVVFNVPVTTYTMTLSADTLRMNPVQVNTSDSTTLTLTNLSCGNLVIDSITHSNPRFSNTLPNTSDVTSMPGYTYLGTYNGHTYFKSNGTSSWLAAESSINTLMGQMGLNGYMLSINDVGENAWILTKIPEDLTWLGLRDADGTGNIFPCESASSSDPKLFCWKWSDGSTLVQNNFSNWWDTEPQNNGGNEDFAGLYGNLLTTVAARGKWWDHNSLEIKHILEVASGFPSGTTNDITVKFESPDVGTFTDTMVIHSNAGLDTVIVFAEALGVPLMVLSIDTAIVDFPACPHQVFVALIIINNGTGPLTLSVKENITPYPSWMSFLIDNPIAPNGIGRFQIGLDNPHLPVGKYHYSIIIQTNDTITPIDTLTLQITVAGDSSLIFEHGEIVFDTIDRNTSVTFTTKLINNGCSPVFVSDISFGSSFFAENASSIYLPPYSSYPMVLKFQPLFTGKFYDTLVVTANIASGTILLPVEGLAQGALTYELSKLASNVNVQDCDGMTMDTIRLYNVGDGQGNWSLANISQIPSWLMVNPQSGTLMEGDSVAIAIGYDATGLINNTYSHTLRINLTDPETAYIDLPSGMNVVGSTLMSFSQDTVDFGLTYFTAMETDTITIYNAGCDTFFVTNVVRDPQFGIDQTSFTVLPDSSKQIIISFTPVATGMYADTVRFIGINNTLYLPVFGQGVNYPQFTKAVKDSIVITMPGPIDASTLNTNTWVVWGEQSGKRTGMYIVSGNDIIFIPTQNFFAGEEVSYTLTQNVKYASGENIQPFSDSKNVKVWNVTQGEFVIRPTDKVFPGIPGEFYLNDINSDGLMDFLFKTSSSSVGVMLRQNNNSISNIINTNHPSDINTLEQLKDFNGDGYNDLIYSSGGATTGKLTVLLNNVNGQFTNGPSFGTGFGARSFVLDFNNDGLFDIINLQRGLLSTFSAKLETHKNLGNGAFSLVQSSNWQHNINDFQYCDLNRDGFQDIIAMGIQPASTFESWHLNFIRNYSGIFQSNIVGGGSQSLSFASKKISNIFGDKGSEPLLKHSGGTYLILNNSNVFPTSAITYNISNLSTNLIVGDIDGDNRNDLVPALNKLSVYNNISDNSFQINNLGYNIGPVISNNMADLDNDGDLDFAFIDAQGKLWIAYNEDNTADMVLSQYAISDTLMCGDSITVPIAIRNTGTSALVWQQDATGGTGNTIPSWLTSSSQYNEIPAGDSLVLNLKIKTTSLTNGSYSFHYIINSNDSENYKDTVAISFMVQTDSSIMINPVAWDFGLVDTAQVYTKNIMINNASCQPITISGAFKAGGVYTVTGLTPNTIAAFSSKTITVSLNPNALTNYKDTLVLTHSYGVQAIPLAAQGCYVSPTTILYEQVCTADSVGVDSTLLMNLSGCDSLVVTYYFLPGLDQQDLKLAMFFNGNANDLSGNNHHGVVNGATLTTDRFGNANSAYSFDGNDYIRNAIDIPETNTTLSLWFKTSQSSTGIYSVNSWVGQGGNDRHLYLSTGNICQRVWNNQTICSTNKNYGDNQWHHVVQTLDQINGQKVFVDNTLVASGSMGVSGFNWQTHLDFGYSTDITPYNIIGQIDDVLFYNRVFNSQDILNLYTSQSSFVYNNSPVYSYSQSCEPIDIGLDTTVLAGANQYGCDSTIINVTALTSPVSNEALVAYYSFDGNAQDMSGWGRNGIVNGATPTTDRQGKPNATYSFDGVNDEIVVNSPYKEYDKELTVSWWTNANNFVVGAGLGQTTYNVENMNTNVWLMHANSSNVMGWWVNDNGTWRTTQTNALSPGWHHIVGTVKGDSIRIYVDGMYQNKAVGITTHIRRNLNSSIVIGRDPRISSNRWLNGKIDQVQIYNRALNINEIQSLYNEQQSYFINAVTTCDTTSLGVDTTTYIGPNGCDVTDVNITSLQSPISNQGLVAYYKLDGDVKDGSGYGNNGTLFGAVSANDRWNQSSSSLFFDGVNDYAEVNHNDAINSYLTTGELSISYWIKPDIGNTRDVIAKRPPSNNGGFVIQANPNQMGYDHDIYTNVGWKFVVIPYTQNQWQHISFTAKQNDAIRVYKNGVLAGSLSLAGNTFVGTSANMRLMANTMALELFQKGNLDEVMIHNRVLSPSEIISLYNQHLTYAQSCDIADIGIDTIIMSSSTACESIQNIVTSLQSPVSSQDLVAYYTFDGNAQDMSGWGNHGSVNGATLTSDRFGNLNGAYSFDGVNDWNEVPSSNNFSANKFTVSAWIFLNQNVGNTQSRIICRQGAGIFDNWGLEIFGSSYAGSNGGNDVTFHTSNGSTTQNSIADANLSLNAWHHVVGVNRADSVFIFINGNLILQSAGIGNQFSGNYPLIIGRTTGGGFYFNGKIDDIQYFGRALSPSEIQALYTNSNTNYTFNYFQSCDTSAIRIDTTIYASAAQNGCDSLAINHTSLTLPISNEVLQAYYNFDGNANDRSGYNRHGVVSGATLTTDQFGNINAAYSFDGVDDFISIASPSSVNLGNNFTISGWVKAPQMRLSHRVIIARGQKVSGHYEVYFDVSTGRLSFYAPDLSPQNFISTTAIDNDSIHQFLITYNGSQIKFYVDGILKSTLSASGSIAAMTQSTRIGQQTHTGQNMPFKGMIDDIIIWNRVLIESEIKQLYLVNKSTKYLIAQKDSLIFFQTIMTGLSDMKTTHITNTSCDTLYLDSIYTTNSVFSHNLTLPYLLPYQSKEFNVTFTPYASVPFAGQLVIRSNGVDTVTIQLSGNGCDLCACPTEDVVLNTQTQLNDFVAQYGGCDTIPVNMSITGDASLTNMAGLQFIKRIEGNLHILNSQAITSMSGWQNLAGLAGELRIENNSELGSIDSLVDLAAIGGQLAIRNNPMLTSLNGLQNLLYVGSNLTITNNAALTNCSAICNLINSTSVPPSGGQGVGGGINITNNPSACSSLNEVTIRCAPACLTGNIVLTTQAEVNAFVAKGNLLSCGTLMGNLTISGANIQSLAGMTFLKQITGNLTIQNNTILPNINGLDSLRKVGNTLSITGNPALVHINGLARLDTVGLDLTIQNNAALAQVNGLANVDRVGRNLNVSSNGSLTNCSGLCTLITVPVSVAGTRTVTNNPSPCSSITDVRIKCQESECPEEDYILTTQAEVNTFIASFNDCDSIIGNLTIEGGNSITNISGLSFITYIGGSLTIRNNNLLTTLAGFDHLQKVNWALRIENNAALTNMTQLRRLKHIGNELRLANNDAMIVLTGLDSVQHIGTNLTLTQNNVLVDASPLCRLIRENVVKGTYFISNNPSPVSSVSEVTAICIYGSQITRVLIQNLPDTTEEGSLLNFTIAVDSPPNDTVTVSLVSSNPTELPLPTTVKIRPGTTSVQVSVLLPDNGTPEKDKTVTITAGAPFLLSATDQLVLTDHNDVPAIELQITQSHVSEGAGLYATSAKVKRLGPLGSILNVTLQSSNAGQVSLPTGVNILANETEKTFFIGVVDNQLADGNRLNTITATAIINSCVCPAPAGTQGVFSGSFTILDNDGPALSLMVNPLSMPEGRTNAGTLTITRNTATNVPLTVQLLSSDTTELVLPATATIPVNASSVNIPLNTKPDLLEDGNQEVTISATSPGYSNGVIWVIVSDINKPDLVIPEIDAIRDTVALQEVLPFKVYIHNKGLTASTRGVQLIGYLSSDATISSDDHVVGQYFLDISIPAGDTIVYGGTGTVPLRTGHFNLLFRINPNESITELLYFNNTSPAVPVTIVPNYTGTANVDNTVFLIGALVVIYGSSYNSQGSKLPNADLDIYLIRDGIRRTIAVKTNAQGDYSYTFHPLQSDFGHFSVGACFPGFQVAEVQDAFDILGLGINNGNFLTWDMLLGDTINSSIPLRNVTSISMANVTLTPLSLPNGCSLVFNTIANFPANTTLSLGYRIIAGAVTTPGVYQQFPIAVKTNNTTLQQVTGYYHCKAQQGFIMASVTSIVQNINKDQSRLVEFTITNKGQGNTGPVSIAVPNANWVRLVSPAAIPSLAPNQSATISVEFIPTSALPLNTPATGNIAINATNAGGISVPFTITKVSDLAGNIFIDVINQFTYFTPEAPHLDSALVRITNYFTGQVYAEGLTNTQGIFHATNLPEGQLRIVVSADRHKTHDGVLDISPGNNGTKVIFLEYRAISFSWDVQPTTTEDEYEIDLIMNFEANVPVPVIVMSMPDTLPRLTGGETFSFYINMTNKGLITANEVKLDLPTDPEYELVTTYQPQDILAQQTIQVPVLMRRRVASGNLNEGNSNQNRIKVNDDVIKKAEQRLNFKKN